MSAFIPVGLMAIAPEAFLAVATMGLLVAGAFRRAGGAHVFVSRLALGALGVAALIVIFAPSPEPETGAVALATGGFARVMKVLVIGGAASAIVMSWSYLRAERLEHFEYPILVLLAVLGMMVMVSARSLLTLYIGLELQSLALYVLAAFDRSSARSSEAGIKYFVLGALASGIFLYGCSFVYGHAGDLTFASAGAAAVAPKAGFLVGMVFVICGLAFKLAAVPFHMWTPDVYEGAPTSVTALFAAAPKAAAMAALVRALFEAFPDPALWRDTIAVLAALSMILGAVAAIGQSGIKRLLAYSAIGHVGYLLAGVAAGSARGVEGVVAYMIIYVITAIGVFACVLMMRRADGAAENISALAGLGRVRPGMAFALAVLLFSLAGAPPLAGFFAKFYVFVAVVDAGLYWLAITGVLSSVAAAFYYLRIVKIMYFDEPEGEEFIRPTPSGLAALVVGAGAFTLVFVLAPAVALEPAAIAAAALLR